MPSTGAGTLRHPVTLQDPGGPPVPDGDGGYTSTPVVLAALWWAEIKPATAKDLERAVAGTVLSTATHLVRMRYLPGVTTQTQILFDTRIFNVTGVANPEERNQELILTAVEVVL